MAKNKRYRVAIVGAGNVAAHHVRAWQQIGDVEVKYLCSRAGKKLMEFAEKFALKPTSDLQDILSDPAIDIVDLTVPSGLHAELGIAAAKAGKHVVVEKPIDVTMEKADALIDTCRQQQVTLGVISQYRFMDSAQKMYEYIRQGKLGRLLQGDASVKWYRSQAYYDSGAWRGTYALDGGGCFVNQAIHFIDLLLSVMGPVKSVTAKTRKAIHNIEVEDMGVALLEFQSGALGVVEASTSFYPGLPARLDIHGSKGTIRLEGEKIGLIHVEGEEPVTAEKATAAGAADPMSIDVTPFVRQFNDILAAIRENREPLVSGREARNALVLVLAIYRSAETGQTVTLF